MGSLEYACEYNVTIAAVNHNGIEGERSSRPLLEHGSNEKIRAPVPLQFPERAARAFYGDHLDMS